jgi:hypothetical protein
MEQPFTLSFFRKGDTIQDWPLGGGKRGTCLFHHESNKRGQRILRTTTGKPKASTYYMRVCLVDGSDGKTHYIGYSQYGFLSVMSCDMQHSDFSIHPHDPNFDEYKRRLFEATEAEE